MSNTKKAYIYQYKYLFADTEAMIGISFEKPVDNEIYIFKIIGEMDIEVPDVPQSEVLGAELSYLKKQMDYATKEYEKKISKLNLRKDELLWELDL